MRNCRTGLSGREADLFANLMHLKAVTEEHLSQRKADGARKAATKAAQNRVKDVAYMQLVSGAAGEAWLAGSNVWALLIVCFVLSAHVCWHFWVLGYAGFSPWPMISPSLSLLTNPMMASFWFGNWSKEVSHWLEHVCAAVVTHLCNEVCRNCLHLRSRPQQRGSNAPSAPLGEPQNLSRSVDECDLSSASLVCPRLSSFLSLHPSIAFESRITFLWTLAK